MQRVVRLEVEIGYRPVPAAGLGAVAGPRGGRLRLGADPPPHPGHQGRTVTAAASAGGPRSGAGPCRGAVSRGGPAPGLGGAVRRWGVLRGPASP